MYELTFNVKRQEDGWYLASIHHERFNIATEAEDYPTLKDKVKEAVAFTFRNLGEAEKIGIPLNPKIKLQLRETLRAAGKEQILIAGNPDGSGYRAISNGALELNLYAETLERLRELISREMENHELDKYNVELLLEESVN